MGLNARLVKEVYIPVIPVILNLNAITVGIVGDAERMDIKYIDHPWKFIRKIRLIPY